MLELEDESVWVVSAYDKYKLRNWHASDRFILTQNNRWFSSYQYRLINRSAGSSIEVNLFLGPNVEQEGTLSIVSMRSDGSWMELSDGSRWQVLHADCNETLTWLPGQVIIIGANSQGDETFSELLLNTSLNEGARARNMTKPVASCD